MNPIVVGVIPGQPVSVLLHAARFSFELRSPLVFAHVERNTTLIEQEKQNLRLRLSLDPPVDDEMAAVALALRLHLERAPALDGIRWTFRVLGGDPARALTRLSDEVGARLILVGGTRRGFAHRAEDLLNGTLAGWLVRHQPRPVVVIPDVGVDAPIR